jgi:hypothetical protein
MSPHEIIKVELENGSGDITVLHDSIVSPAVNGLSGGKHAPTLSVGGNIIVMEDLSVGFDTTIAGNLSVADMVQANLLSVSSIYTSVISTQTLHVGSSSLDQIQSTDIISETGTISEQLNVGVLSVNGAVCFENDEVLFNGQCLTLQQDLSVGGIAQMNLISVSNLYVNMLSVASGWASELSVQTLYVQQVATSDPDEDFSG